MKRVKVKIKHLMVATAGVILFIGLIIPNAVLFRAEYINKKDTEASKVLYKRYIDYFPFAFRKDEALYKLSEEIVPNSNLTKRYKIFINGISFGNNYVTGDMRKNACNYYREILENYKESKFYNSAYRNLMNQYISNGEFEEGQKLIELGLKVDNTELKEIALKYKMLYSIVERHFSEGAKIGNDLIGKGKQDGDVYMLMGDLNYYTGQYEQALVFYEKAKNLIELNKYNSADAFYMNFFENCTPDDKISLINKIRSGFSGNSGINGCVYIDGKPAAFTYVYLKDCRDGKLNSIGNENRSNIAITDRNGNYEFSSLLQGNYILGVGLVGDILTDITYPIPSKGYVTLKSEQRMNYNFNFVRPMNVIKPKINTLTKEDQVELQWEEVKGAAYYLVKFVVFENPEKMEGSYQKVGDETKIYTTQYTLNLKEINKKSFGFIIDEEGNINPQAYLGIFYAGSKVPFFVEAYDENDAMINSSTAIRTTNDKMRMIRTPEAGLTEGDKLILEGNVESAIKCYEEDLKKNKNDLHALDALATIYSIGTKRSSFYLDRESEGQNITKALELNKQLYALTKDTAYFSKIQNNFDKSKGKNYKVLLEEYMNIDKTGLETSDLPDIVDMDLEIKEFKKIKKNVPK